jgi:hypothetical protein
MKKTETLLLLLASTVMLTSCAGDMAAECDDTACDDSCVRAGNPSGICSAGACECLTAPDGDGDGDLDSDTDVDSDADSDGDSDGDMDIDADTDTDSDIDSDSDTEADADPDPDVDFDTGPDPRECNSCEGDHWCDGIGPRCDCEPSCWEFGPPCCADPRRLCVRNTHNDRHYCALACDPCDPDPCPNPVQGCVTWFGFGICWPGYADDPC